MHQQIGNLRSREVEKGVPKKKNGDWKLKNWKYSN